MPDKYDRIDIARKQLGLTYEDLKEVFDISPDAIRKAIVVRKNLKPIYFNKFIERFGISKEWIENGSGEMELQPKIGAEKETKEDIYDFDENKWPLDVIRILQEQKKAFDAIQKIQDRKILILTDKVEKLNKELNNLKSAINKY
jgi:hypothetical protein